MWNNINAVIFDLDGTLADSMWIWEDIDIRFLAERGIPMPKDLQKTIEGQSMWETALYFKKHFPLEESLEELIKIWNDMAYEAYQSRIPLKPGAREFMDFLRERQVRMGMSTSNSRELVEAFLTAQNITGYFDTIVTSNEVPHGKPAPDVYLCAMERLGMTPLECLVFEDILPGIEAGKAAGMQVYAVHDDYSKNIEQEKRRMSDRYIMDYYELLGGRL